MRHQVYLVKDAEDDLYDIYKFVAANDSPGRAKKLLEKIQAVCELLANLPKQGHVPPELERIGIFEYKEIHYKPYRIIYRIIEKTVYIHCILDGRRDLQDLLTERLMR